MKKTVCIVMMIFVVALCSSTLFAAGPCSKAEVKANVEKVAAILEKEGTAFYAKIPAYHFCDNNYVYVSDMTATILAHGFMPHLVGKCIIGIKDDTGYKFFADLVAKIKSSTATKNGKTYYNGATWIKYRWPSPKDKTKFENKLVYAQGVLLPNGDNVFVAAGTYEQ